MKRSRLIRQALATVMPRAHRPLWDSLLECVVMCLAGIRLAGLTRQRAWMQLLPLWLGGVLGGTVTPQARHPLRGSLLEGAMMSIARMPPVGSIGQVF